ncbi:unnamed protein product [Pleuronectes platessa]|uniref:Uncharacterized protein n=1 Tax=Pleuronectes platessa TaxID=8262 RepID=A0A9N7U4I9_PLEPL|nr:unnamed protein product [Pleuronectes platessa]
MEASSESSSPPPPSPPSWLSRSVITCCRQGRETTEHEHGLRSQVSDHGRSNTQEAKDLLGKEISNQNMWSDSTLGHGVPDHPYRVATHCRFNCPRLSIPAIVNTRGSFWLPTLICSTKIQKTTQGGTPAYFTLKAHCCLHGFATVYQLADLAWCCLRAIADRVGNVCNAVCFRDSARRLWLRCKKSEQEFHQVFD